MENRTVNLVISTSRLTMRNIVAGVRMYLQHRTKVNAARAAGKKNVQEEIPHGKQTVKQLIGQNQGVSNVEVTGRNIKLFEKVAGKYGVDFAVKKDKTASPPRYLVFFKARDADALTAVLKEVTFRTMQREKRPSILKQLKKFQAIAASIPGKIRNKEKERTR